MLNGYCSPAYAFSKSSMETKAKNVAMKSMPDCPGMNDISFHQPSKAIKINCKACCISLIGFPSFSAVHNIESRDLKFPAFDSAAQSDINFPIFHPPKSLA
jgi:hypothetical protein